MTRLPLILLLACSPLALTTPALAQPRVMTSVGNPGGAAASSVSKTSFERYTTILHLDEAQKEAARALFDSYQKSTREASESMQDQMKSMQADLKEGEASDAMKKMPAIIQKHGETTGKLTRQFLDDLKSILTKDQLQNDWPALERFRRRAAWLRTAPISGAAVDLTALVAKLNLPTTLTAKLHDPLTQYELDMDRILIERERFEADMAKPKARNADDAGPAGLPLFNPEDFEKRYKADRDNAEKVRELNQRSQRQLAALLPDTERARFDELFQAASFKSIYRETYTGKTLKAAEKFSDLSAEQKQRLQSIQETYDRELKAANARWAAAQQRAEAEGKAHAFPILTMDGGDDPTPPDLKEARTARRDLDKKTSDDLAALLTEEQRARLPQRSDLVASNSGGRRSGMRVMAHSDGTGEGNMVVVAADDGAGPMMDADDEDGGGEGETIVRRVIVTHGDTPAAGDPAPTSGPSDAPKPGTTPPK